MKEFLKAFKRIFLEYKYFILFALLLSYGLEIPLPYYIYTPGGVTNLSDKYEIAAAYKSEGTFNLVYVSSYQATVSLYLISFFNNNWEVVKNSEVLNSNETDEDLTKRDILYLEEANQNAVINAYLLAKKDIEITNTHIDVIYIMDSAQTSLKIGDEILAIDNNIITEYNDIANYIKTKEVGETVLLKVKRDDQEKTVKSTIVEYKGEKIMGIIITTLYDLKTTPKINFNFDSNEEGPSAGLMLTLSIYDSLIKEDLTKGYKIAGTGTIDELGNVGEIGEVEKKLESAVKAKADIFFAPEGDNYSDAKRVTIQKGYTIKLVGVANVNEAVKYLNNLK